MEKKDAPKKNAESHRGKKVASKNEEKQLHPPSKKKKTVSPRKKSLAKEKKSRAKKKRDSLAK